ncbi:hypothetical protein UY3_10632 [Chelonia mydas]|uniref:Uncharacterized protein n=1 Tax=Chelonia mydas TaxID=8469 RepID=M7BJK8_CHEMY|nr:hypothetical protein UY3_10632 [Chelonia mydas]
MRSASAEDLFRPLPIALTGDVAPGSRSSASPNRKRDIVLLCVHQGRDAMRPIGTSPGLERIPLRLLRGVLTGTESHMYDGAVSSNHSQCARKTSFLVAITSARKVCELHALMAEPLVYSFSRTMWPNSHIQIFIKSGFAVSC